MPTQSIDLSAVSDATFNGTAIDAINLNGTEVWTGGPSLEYIEMTGWPNYSPAKSGTGAWVPVVLGQTAIMESGGVMSMGMVVGKDYVMKTPIGSAPLFYSSASNDVYKICNISAEGDISSQGVVGWGYASAGNPAYNIPASANWYYIGMVGDNIVFGSSRIVGGSTGQFSTTQQIKTFIDGETMTASIGSGIAYKSFNDDGLVWVTSNYLAGSGTYYDSWYTRSSNSAEQGIVLK